MRQSRLPRIIHVFADGHLVFDRFRIRCSLGRGSVTLDKQEGDGATPVGLFPLRALWFRSDRVRPLTRLPKRPILLSHGWCDAASHGSYNRAVRLPFTASHEQLRRDDELYDLILTIGHNDNPPQSGQGSAIFIHVMPPGGATTAGCIAPSKDDLLWMLTKLQPGDLVRVHSAARISPGFPLRRVLPSGASCVRLPRN